MKKDLLKLLDLTSEDILEILDLADQLKYDVRHGIQHNRLAGKTLAMIFAKNSTRTRASFETGMFQLGGHAMYLTAADTQIGRGEPIQDTARTLSRYCENSVRGGYEAVTHRLSREWNETCPDAIFCGSSAIAHGAIRAFYKAGISGDQLPKLIAVGNGAEETDEFAVPSLSVVHLPMEQMARECFQLALDLLDGKITNPESRLLPVEYIARESCGGLSEEP